MLEAHVRFELARWSDSGLRDAIAEEAGAAWAWLAGVRVAELAPPAYVRDAVLRALDAPLPDELHEMLAGTLAAARAALHVQDDVTLAELVAEEDYRGAVEIVVGLRELRHEVITQITTSTVYAKLVAHVLYHGIKDYLVTQNVLARRIPGASSMLRLGQSAMSAAAPGLERSVDKQLTAFVAKNVQDTAQGSREFLVGLLDDDMIRAVGDELWATNSPRPVGEAVRMVPGPSADQALRAGRGLWAGVCETPVVPDAVMAAVDAFYAAHGERTAAELLAGLGLTPAILARELTEAVLPAVGAARSSGFLESRIRARLEAFYAAYRGKTRAPEKPESNS